MSGLILENINKSFFQGKQEIKALKNINIKIDKGQVVSLIGPSGSGKTTLLQIAGLLDQADSGSIIIDGHNLSQDHLKNNDQERTLIRRNSLGFIYQFHNLLPEFNALENIAMPLLIKGVKKNQALKQANDLLEKMHLKDRAEHRPAQLSGGQQQRVAIARAIITKPAILLSDEPTGNLDSENANNIFDILHKFSREYNMATLIVTHNDELAAKTDKIFKIKDGQIK